LPRGWGLLYDNDYIDMPQPLYCPAVTSAVPFLLYNGTGNVWKAAGVYTRASYGVRPERLVATNDSAATAMTKMPLLKDYHAKALAADACSNSGQMVGMHGRGLNVVYGDGHVRWVDRSLLAASWLAIPANASWSTGYDNAGTALWNSFDAAR
jgi:prepilin-type processing-associated H-X9-DG protein